MGDVISEIWRYPVKSMIGQAIKSANLEARGLDGDRGWATRDEVRGGIRGAKKIGELMRFGAKYVDDIGGTVEITFPDGDTVRTDDPDVNARVSAALGHEVTLWPLQPGSPNVAASGSVVCNGTGPVGGCWYGRGQTFT